MLYLIIFTDISFFVEKSVIYIFCFNNCIRPFCSFGVNFLNLTNGFDRVIKAKR